MSNYLLYLDCISLHFFWCVIHSFISESKTKRDLPPQHSNKGGGVDCLQWRSPPGSCTGCYPVFSFSNCSLIFRIWNFMPHIPTIFRLRFMTHPMRLAIRPGHHGRPAPNRSPVHRSSRSRPRPPPRSPGILMFAYGYPTMKGLWNTTWMLNHQLKKNIKKKKT